MRTPGSSDPGRLRTPGLVDQHCHGFAGVDFATAPVSAVRDAVRELALNGVTRVVASLPTLPRDETRAAVRRLAPLVREGLVAGIHLEGPFLAASRCGAHRPEDLQDPADPDSLRWLEAVLRDGRSGGEQTLVAMTYAPELDGAVAVESALASHGVLPCPGHTDATAAQVGAAVDRLTRRSGAEDAGDTDGPGPTPSVTHLFNAMRGFHHRDPGPVPPLLRAATAGLLRVELIADGHHVDREVVVDLLRLLPAAVCVVSDASAATGAPAGAYTLGGVGIESHGATAGTVATGAPHLVGRDTLASGSVPLDGALRNLLRWGVPLPAALDSVSTTPARTLPAHRRDAGWVEWVTDPETGQIAPGRPAVVVP
ncbi:N-acetylglucosamine-6-phosphate deacetylase [Citricoccus sp. I39-566]|uniref:N-acetylglucosamine-6-phosphate deacetylase n=1 Tax=Citricoccus sp. I39-566 TaxID=3073268 RepID=UPI00286BEC48|nr:N-acetylglucosamine-6-phosphate deacetylase [Citricoccus sp. I39-566]WMY76997.1 N-acetylglucosamine-6-phosphate deacetylase [Citricoccus sp. I39-566]